ncbi:hypothetical protein EL17_20850 [Anditalea andensis]|uniref:LD-carboxypeptidase n=2 Tax=Anditalea andensis TaxID=1048983 RepID=A0A074LDU8_9BACT|nr:hypothetical protein EL17_20850 [Anditalea andensis]
MSTITPPKLKFGQRIRVIFPSAKVKPCTEVVHNAVVSLENVGLDISFSDPKATFPGNWAEDFNQAIMDPDIHGLLLATGIDNDHQFRRIDYEAIMTNPKIIFGMAEAPLLSLYLYQKTGLINYYGPNLSMLGRCDLREECLRAMTEILMVDATIRIFPSSYYGNGKYQIRKNEIWVIQEGMAEGKFMIVGNCTADIMALTFNGSYDYSGNIVFIDGNDFKDLQGLKNNIQMLINTKGGTNLNGLIIGAIEGTGISPHQVKKIIYDNVCLAKIPVLANVNFIKSDPKFTLPIGGVIRMNIKQNHHIKLDITEH